MSNITKYPNKSFKIINEFIKEIYGFNFIQKPMDKRISEINDLEEAYKSIMEILNCENSFSNNFTKIYPIIEPAVQWNQLKMEGKITENFLNKSKPRFKNQGNFYGTLFELDIASRFLLANCKVNLDIEDYKKHKQQIDFIVNDLNQKKNIGIECTSKRFTQKLTNEKINRTIREKSTKFEDQNIKKLNLKIDEKILIMDLTRENYQKPRILSELDEIKLNSNLDNIIFTWRENISHEQNKVHLKVNYKNLIDKEYKCLHSSYLTELRHENGKGFYYMMKHSQNPPKLIRFGKWRKKV